MTHSKILKFEEYTKRHFELPRKPVNKETMPDANREAEYRGVVSEEMVQMLQDIWHLTKDEAIHFDALAWNDYFNEWRDLFKKALVNWDLPDLTAQKVLKKLEPYIKTSS